MSTQLLRLELAEAEAAEALVVAKEAWPVCPDCGRSVPESRVKPKIKDELALAKARLHSARTEHRRVREAEAPSG